MAHRVLTSQLALGAAGANRLIDTALARGSDICDAEALIGICHGRKA